MPTYLDSNSFPGRSDQNNDIKTTSLKTELSQILTEDFEGSYFELFGNYQLILSDNHKKTYVPKFIQNWKIFLNFTLQYLKMSVQLVQKAIM